MAGRVEGKNGVSGAEVAGGEGAFGDLRDHVVQSERLAEPPSELGAAEQQDDLGHLRCETQRAEPVEASHQHAPRRAEPLGDEAHVAELVGEDLVVEELDASGDGWLGGEELAAPVAEGAEESATDHLPEACERQERVLGRRDKHLDERAGEEPRRPSMNRQAEDRNHVAQDARVVRLLEVHVETHGVAVGADTAVELREAHAEPFGLIRLGRGEEPQLPLGEPRLGTRAGEVAQVGRPVEADAGAHRRARQPGEDLLAPGEAMALEVGFAVAVNQERPVPLHHGRLRRSTSTITSAVSASRASPIASIAVPAGPAPIERDGMPLPARPPSGVITMGPDLRGGRYGRGRTTHNRPGASFFEGRADRYARVGGLVRTGYWSAGAAGAILARRGARDDQGAARGRPPGVPRRAPAVSRGAQGAQGPRGRRHRRGDVEGHPYARTAAHRADGRGDAGRGRHRARQGAARETPRGSRRHVDRILRLRARLRGAQGRGGRLPPEECVAGRDPADGRAGGRRGADAVRRDRRARAARVRTGARGGARPRAALGPHGARGGDPEAARHRRVEPRDRPPPLHQRADREEPRREHLPEAPGERPDEGRAAGSPAGARGQGGDVSPRTRSVLRVLVIAAGVVVTAASMFTFRREDWPSYATFALLSLALYGPWVEVLPELGMPMPGIALTIGFLYIAGPPVIVLRVVMPLALRLVRATVPERWAAWLPDMVGGAGELVAGTAAKFPPRPRAVVAAEYAVFALGLAARWRIVSLLVPAGRPAARPLAMLLGEIGGYTCWGVLSLLPLYRFQSVPSVRAEMRPVMVDLGLITALVTAFVFLITYGYQAHGLPAAAMWSLAALALHFMLKRHNERRLLVEAQNQRLAALNRELEQRDRLSAIGKMSSVVSHQMLQQLGVIGLYADLIRSAEAGDAPAAAVGQAKASAAAIEDALGGVNRVLEDLLVFSRDLRLNLYEHRLHDVLAECLEECRPQAAERGVALRLECPADTSARLDKLKVKQAVVNVLRNAIEASPPGADVVVRCGLADGAAEIAVTDRGPGIPAADRAAIFTPFFTTKVHGSGLGLAIAREFAEAHGGAITAESRDGGGATFVLRLPREGRLPREVRFSDRRREDFARQL